MMRQNIRTGAVLLGAGVLAARGAASLAGLSNAARPAAVTGLAAGAFTGIGTLVLVSGLVDSRRVRSAAGSVE